MYFVCWNHNCRQTHNSEMFKSTDIKCKECGRDLVSPNGKVQLSLNPYVIKTINPEKLEHRGKED